MLLKVLKQEAGWKEKMRYSFETRLNKEQCVEKLYKGIDAKKLLGKVSGDKFIIHRKVKYSESPVTINKHIDYPVFHGKMIAKDGRTIIEGRFILHPYISVIFQFLLLTCIIIGMALNIYQRGSLVSLPDDKFSFIIFAIIFLTFFFFMKSIARKDKDYIIRYLINELHVKGINK